jgi:Leucine-rich repeat (LRR) protein
MNSKLKFSITVGLFLAMATLTSAMELTKTEPKIDLNQTAFEMHTFPKEALLNILKYLSLKQCTTVNTVCKDWQNIFTELDLNGFYRGRWEKFDGLTTYNVLKNIIPTFPKLKKLIMVNIGCGAWQTSGLFTQLQKMDQLEFLNMSHNSIGDMSNCDSEAYLKKTTKLKVLILQNTGLKYLAFGHIVEFLIDIKNVSSGNHSITHMDFSQNPLGVGGAWSIRRLLAHNNTLEFLNFSKCAIEDFGLELIAEGLGSNKTLSTLILAENQFTPLGIEQYKEAIKDQYEYNEQTGVTKRISDRS